jgi:hypothetical protein
MEECGSLHLDLGINKIEGRDVMAIDIHKPLIIIGLQGKGRNASPNGSPSDGGKMQVIANRPVAGRQ